MAKNKFIWNVWIWDFNTDKIELYDVVPRFEAAIKAMKPKNRPKTKEELEHALDSEARYMFWAKCEYEMIVTGWPKRKNEEKVDVYRQLRTNWNVFVNCYWEEYSKKLNARKKST